MSGPVSPKLTTTDGMSLLDVVKSDYEAVVALDPLKPKGLARTLDVLTQVGFLAVVVFRLSHELHRRDRRIPARLLLMVQQIVFSCELFPQAEIGPGLAMAHPMGVGVGAGVRLGASVRLFAGVRLGSAGSVDPERDGFPEIGDGAHLYDGAKVFGPVTVGEGARIGANVVLLESVPPRGTAVAPRASVRDPRDA
jgi:serine O-acetyltransferase